MCDGQGVGPAKEMPRYQYHKKVWALKIKTIASDGAQGVSGYIITPEEDGFGPITVDAAYLEKHQPRSGGYYVRYEGGYESFSPADVFEEGYTLIGPENETVNSDPAATEPSGSGGASE